MFGCVTVTPRKVTLDHVRSHVGIARSDIVGAEWTVLIPRLWVALRIRHIGGVMQIPVVRTRHAKEIIAALGF